MIADIRLDNITFIGVAGVNTEDIKNKVVKMYSLSEYGKSKLEVVERK